MKLCILKHFDLSSLVLYTLFRPPLYLPFSPFLLKKKKNVEKHVHLQQPLVCLLASFLHNSEGISSKSYPATRTAVLSHPFFPCIPPLLPYCSGPGRNSASTPRSLFKLLPARRAAEDRQEEKTKRASSVCPSEIAAQL